MVGLILYFHELLEVPHDEYADEFQNYTLGLAIEISIIRAYWYYLDVQKKMRRRILSGVGSQSLWDQSFDPTDKTN